MRIYVLALKLMLLWGYYRPLGAYINLSCLLYALQSVSPEGLLTAKYSVYKSSLADFIDNFHWSWANRRKSRCPPFPLPLPISITVRSGSLCTMMQLKTKQRTVMRVDLGSSRLMTWIVDFYGAALVKYCWYFLHMPRNKCTLMWRLC